MATAIVLGLIVAFILGAFTGGRFSSSIHRVAAAIEEGAEQLHHLVYHVKRTNAASAAVQASPAADSSAS